MSRRKSGSGAGVLVLIGIVVVAIAAIPKEVWIGIGVIGIIVLTVHLYAKFKGTRTSASTHSSADEPTLAQLMAARPASKSSKFQNLPRSSPGPEQFFDTPEISPNGSTATTGFRIPLPPRGISGNAKWIRPGTCIDIAGMTIRDGLIYVGTSLRAPLGNNDPCLIDPQMAVATTGDFTRRETDYWPSYSNITPSARRAYLNWLMQGRCHPNADIGYVFLFFYGLERRILVGEQDDPTAEQDWPAIKTELHRLLSIYGEKPGSFQRYAGALLDWMTLVSLPLKLYERPIPAFPRTYELPGYLRVALGQAAVDRAPIPAELALAWVRANPGISLRTSATRCPSEFDHLFIERYKEIFSAGIVLPHNRTKLKCVYRPASFGFSGITKSFGDIPDVTVLTGPIKQLQEVVNSCAQDLDGFSRIVGKNPAARTSLDGLLQLPATLWPEEMRKKLQTLANRLESGVLALPFAELVNALGGASGAFTRDKARALARTLETSSIGLEPNVLAGAKIPTASDPVVLFAMPPGEDTAIDGGAYQVAMLTLQLASTVAHADGDFSASEVNHLRKEIHSWKYLTPRQQQRLQAHLLWLTKAPLTLVSLKKRLELVDLKAKETIAAFMAAVAQADGIVSPSEVKFLEKAYKALGVDAKRVFSDVHTAATGSVSMTKIEAIGFKLDVKRVAELQQDTEIVSALLANIFDEDDVPASLMPSADKEPEEIEPTTRLLGLDDAHSALARLMLSRPQWTREELEDAAADLELMLDGALEHLNEASFDVYDLPFADGDDPVEVNAEVLEKIEA